MTKPEGSATPNPLRLRKRSEFLAVRAGAKRRGPLFLLEVLNRGDESPPRVGLTVTKKAGNAVERNRIKRRLRAIVRTQADEMADGADYVIVGRSDLLKARFSDIQAEFSRRLRRI